MVNQNLRNLIEALIEQYGDLYSPYGTSPSEPEGTGFRIAGTEATFSVMCAAGDADEYDVQIESDPPGNYLFNTVTTLHGLMVLIPVFGQPQERWPQ